MNADKHQLWVEKYRPSNLSNYVFHDDSLKATIDRLIADQTIPHLLLSGVPGTGKTTLSHILVNELGIDDIDVLTIKSSDENSVDVMREKVKGFISTYAMGKFKVVQLEEADRISPAGQDALKHFLEEEYADTARFILTCNHENKIIPAIKSRVQHFRFKAPNRDDVTEVVANILIKEKIKFDIDLLDKYVAAGYPDIRKIVNLLQQNSNNGVLQPVVVAEAGDYKFKLIDMLETDSWKDARVLACENVLAEEWEDLYRFLYENLHKTPKFKNKDKWEQGIVTIADHLYKHSIVADPEINAAAMFIKLSQI